MKTEITFDVIPTSCTQIREAIRGEVRVKIEFEDITVTAHVGLTSTHFDIDCGELHLKGYSGEQLVELAAPAIRAMAKEQSSATSAPASSDPSSASGS